MDNQAYPSGMPDCFLRKSEDVHFIPSIAVGELYDVAGKSQRRRENVAQVGELVTLRSEERESNTDAHVDTFFNQTASGPRSDIENRIRDNWSLSVDQFRTDDDAVLCFNRARLSIIVWPCISRTEKCRN